MSKVNDDKVGVDSGTNEQMSIAGVSEKECGMDTVGKDQKPQPTPKKSAGTKYGKSFRFK